MAGGLSLFMPNPIGRLADSAEPVTLESVLKGLSEVPFVGHQFKWLVGELRRHSPADGAVLMAGYCGLKKMDASRRARLGGACALLAGMSQSEFERLPETIQPSVSQVGQPLPKVRSGGGNSPIRKGSDGISRLPANFPG